VRDLRTAGVEVRPFGTTLERIRPILVAATGVDLDDGALVRVGERIWNLERLWNLRAGFTAADDTLPRRMLEEAILHASPAGPEAAELFRRHFRTQILEWRERWGYEKAPLQRPTRSNDRTLILLAHSLRTHAREMLSRLAGGLAADGETAPPAQEEEARETIAAVFRDLDSALETGRQLCRQYGVQP